MNENVVFFTATHVVSVAEESLVRLLESVMADGRRFHPGLREGGRAQKVEAQNNARDLGSVNVRLSSRILPLHIFLPSPKSKCFYF